MLSFKIGNQLWDDSVQILACTLDGEGRIAHYVEPVLLTLKPHERGRMIENPTLRLDGDEARNLMGALWEAGIRPAGYQDSRAEVRRMEAHIEDLRRVAFNADQT